VTRLPALCRAAGLPEPEPEYRFCAGRRWRFDWAWPGHRVALEVEGAVYARGRHVRGKGYTADCRKYSKAAALGWRVLRCTTEMMRRGEWLELLREALACQAFGKTPPRPTMERPRAGPRG
jgi:hypothetical protein